MTLHWWFLTPTLVLMALALLLFLVRRGERATGKVLFWILPPVSWSRESHPELFKFRQAGLWIPIGIFVLASMAFFAEFLGIVQ